MKVSIPDQPVDGHKVCTWRAYTVSWTISPVVYQYHRRTQWSAWNEGHGADLADDWMVHEPTSGVLTPSNARGRIHGWAVLPSVLESKDQYPEFPSYEDARDWLADKARDLIAHHQQELNRLRTALRRLT